MEEKKDYNKQQQPLQKFYFTDDGKLVVESNKGVWVDGEQYVKMYGNFSCNAKTLGAIIAKLRNIKVEVGSITTHLVTGFSLPYGSSTEYITKEYCALNIDEERIGEMIRQKARDMAETDYAKRMADFINNNSKEVKQLRERIDDFNALPWYKRLFKKIEA